MWTCEDKSVLLWCRWADQFAELDLGGAGPDAMAAEFLEQQARGSAHNFSGPQSGPNVGDTMAREFLRQKVREPGPPSWLPSLSSTKVLRRQY